MIFLAWLKSAALAQSNEHTNGVESAIDSARAIFALRETEQSLLNVVAAIECCFTIATTKSKPVGRSHLMFGRVNAENIVLGIYIHTRGKVREADL